MNLHWERNCHFVAFVRAALLFGLVNVMTYKMIRCIRQVWSEQHFSISIHRLHLNIVLFFQQRSGLASKNGQDKHALVFVCKCDARHPGWYMIVLVLRGELSHERLSRVNTLLLEGCPKGLGYVSDLLSFSPSANLLSKSILCTHLTHRIVGVHFYVRHVVLKKRKRVFLYYTHPYFRIHEFHDAFLLYYSNAPLQRPETSARSVSASEPSTSRFLLRRFNVTFFLYNLTLTTPPRLDI